MRKRYHDKEQTARALCRTKIGLAEMVRLIHDQNCYGVAILRVTPLSVKRITLKEFINDEQT